MEISYITKGVCSRRIFLEMEGNVVKKVRFEGGCNGNTKGISALAEGMKAEDVIEKLQGIKCGFKNTSCPDQLSQALKEYLSEKGD